MAKKNIKKNEPKGFKNIVKGDWLKGFKGGETTRFVIGLVILTLALFMLLAIISFFLTGSADQTGIESHTLTHPANYGGILGSYMAYYLLNDCFGASAILIPVFLLLLSLHLMRAYNVKWWKWFINLSLLMVWFSVALSFASIYLPDTWLNAVPFHLGGAHGNFICQYLLNQIGAPITFVALMALAICYLVYLSRETINIIRKVLHPQDYIIPKRFKRKDRGEGGNTPAEDGQDEDFENEVPLKPYNEEQPINIDLNTNDNFTDKDKQNEEDEINDEEGDILPPPLEKKKESEADFIINDTTTKEEKAEGKTAQLGGVKTAADVENLPPYDPRLDLENYRFPTLSLLKKYGDTSNTIDMQEQQENKERIITVLRNFGVEITSIKATIGPTITLYEITPAAGVRITRIRNLEDDIALSLSALGIRIIAPIPGKGSIGIEVPNKNPRIVSMESIINSKKFQETTYELPIALGKTITNEVFMVDLAKMPHLLVAGATGQGKSVGLNAIITSLIYKKHPAELKFVMVDPKKVEFSFYAPIENHFLAKLPDNEDAIITDVTKVVQTLKSLCQLMDRRYDLLKMAKARNVKEYNEKFKSRKLNPDNGHEYMPYIVVIIDEFGDLIMTAGKEVELPIARIAQLARAVGIHMVIATQRPTTNIITGTIKANFPARMAFKVMSQIDSRTVLDRPGANQLVGKGDMLFLSGNDPERVQCAFVDTPEVEQINAHIARQQSYPCAYELPEVLSEGDGEGVSGPLDTGNLDPMFEEAARLIVIHQQGSTSLIQRKFAIGYNRAGRLMDQLERAGIVGPAQGSKPREVLCTDETDLEYRLANLKN